MRPGFFPKDPGSFGFDRLESLVNRFSLDHHPRTAAIRPVIHGTVAVVGGPIPEVMNADLQDFPLARAPQEAFRHRPLEHRRENVTISRRFRCSILENVLSGDPLPDT